MWGEFGDGGGNSGKFGDSEQFLNPKKLLTVPEFPRISSADAELPVPEFPLVYNTIKTIPS
jgi:hypothetical protein